ncbi:class I adenylate-forming enzyme family protein [Desulforhabdus sp. TSK]|uniref:class I adenylate-forming enzyme family protein n=1 Tax=Desulforhabdus sp. TSK TaxID=2925014 RepID=UPI001FC89C6F|nr:long-chain-fatty-acid--CoA ligase [Desulforhabdus sp. TSK]GKT09736.1 acyl-CoA synthetase [Desulforhabdus sp. TSK]
MSSEYTLRAMLTPDPPHDLDKPAFIENDRQFTYREFIERTRRMGNALLGFGLQKGDRVAILSKNSIENAESYFSIPNAGLVLVMLNFRLAMPEVETILDDAQASVLMVHEEYLDQIEQIRPRLSFVKHFILFGNQSKLREGWHDYEALMEQSSPQAPPVEVADDDLAALMYTSGTTGSPKGCMVLHSNFHHVGRAQTVELRTTRDDVALIPAPLFHAAGMVILMDAVYNGATTLIMPNWDLDAFLQLVEKYKVTLGVLATPMLAFLTDYPGADRYDLSSLKSVLFAGAPVTPVVFEKAIERFGNVFVHGYGTTETVGTVSNLRVDQIGEALAQGRKEILGSCGKSYPNMEPQVVDDDGNPVPAGGVGDVRVRGQGVTAGYWNKKRETESAYKNGWYYTGDQCRVDEYGFMYIVGRKKEMIITGAENVYPAEVESVLYKHPAVGQAAVVGMKDDKWGEIVTAFIVKRPDSEITQDELKTFCRKEIAGYKIPKKILFVDSLPMSPSGKILKYKLKEEAAA